MASNSNILIILQLQRQDTGLRYIACLGGSESLLYDNFAALSNEEVEELRNLDEYMFTLRIHLLSRGSTFLE